MTKKAFTPPPKYSMKKLTLTPKHLVRGFTIIEVIVAITVLTVGVLGIAVFFSLSLKATNYANHTTTASNLVQGVVDTELAKSYNELLPGTGTRVAFSTDPASPYHIYYETVNITLIDQNLATVNAPGVGLKKIDVTIDWTEGSEAKNVQMSTIKTE